MKFTAQVIFQHHGAVQPHIAISRLARAPSRPQTIRMAHHCALKKQPANLKQTTLLWSTVAVKLDSTFIKLCVCVKKSNFLSWAIRMAFVDPVTYYVHVCWWPSVTMHNLVDI